MTRKTDRVEVFRGRDWQWYWRRKARNGEIIAASEGYTRRWSAFRGARRANGESVRIVDIWPSR